MRRYGFRSKREAVERALTLLDCLIAAVAIRAGIPILAKHRDFELIAEHTSLELST